MATTTRDELDEATTATTEPESDVAAEVVVPAADKLDLEEVRKLVGARNVMGTCSG